MKRHNSIPQPNISSTWDMVGCCEMPWMARCDRFFINSCPFDVFPTSFQGRGSSSSGPKQKRATGSGSIFSERFRCLLCDFFDVICALFPSQYYLTLQGTWKFEVSSFNTNYAWRVERFCLCKCQLHGTLASLCLIQLGSWFFFRFVHCCWNVNGWPSGTSFNKARILLHQMVSVSNQLGTCTLGLKVATVQTLPKCWLSGMLRLKNVQRTAAHCKNRHKRPVVRKLHGARVFESKPVCAELSDTNLVEASFASTIGPFSENILFYGAASGSARALLRQHQ